MTYRNVPTEVFSDQLTGAVSATGSTFQDLGFPAVPVTVGAGGKLKVTVSSQFNVPSNAGIQGGVVSVGIDGANPTGVLAGLLVVAASGGSAPNISASVTIVVSGLTPGGHTLKCIFQAESPSGCLFTNTFMQAESL